MSTYFPYPPHAGTARGHQNIGSRDRWRGEKGEIAMAVLPASPRRLPRLPKVWRLTGGPRVRWVGKVRAYLPTSLIFISVTIKNNKKW